MTAYYNEFDPHAAQWLRNLIAAGVIAPGDVDERSIEDVTPNDLRGYTQCHFFAGIGGWAYALDLAGWPRDRPVWTGSCPCQPFSAAGKGAGFEDERHLWPAWQHLINQCRPPVIFGEQVASKAVDAWIDLVHTDMEGMGYAFGCIPFPATGIGAPHIRDRTYWVADAEGHGHERAGQLSEQAGRDGASHLCADGWLADAGGQGSFSGALSGVHRGQKGAGPRHGELERPCADGGLADTEVVRREGQHLRAGRGLPQVGIANIGGASDVADATSARERPEPAFPRARLRAGGGGKSVPDGCEVSTSNERPGPTNGFWRYADWLGCRDGKWRPVEPGTFPLAHGVSGRVGLLRGYGNAIVPEAAAAFVIAYAEAVGIRGESALDLFAA